METIIAKVPTRDGRVPSSSAAAPRSAETVLDALEASGLPTPAQRFSQLRALREVSSAPDEILESVGAPTLRRRIWRLALDRDDWPLAAAIGTAMQALNEADADDAVDLGIALWRQGRFESAVDLTRRTLLAHPRCARAGALFADLRAWSATRHSELALHGDCELFDHNELRLEPLGHHHLGDFAWQYADPAISERCCLPDFISASHWHRWLDDCLAPGDQALYGIWHCNWGFVGCVNLVIHRDIGFFYYWIGADFRGYGYGPEAGSMLLRFAYRNWGLRACYAKVYDDNQSSRIGLSKIGFAELDVPIQRHRANPESLLRWPAPDRDITEEARDFLDAIGTESRVLRPMKTPSLLASTSATFRVSRHHPHQIKYHSNQHLDTSYE